MDSKRRIFSELQLQEASVTTRHGSGDPPLKVLLGKENEEQSRGFPTYTGGCHGSLAVGVSHPLWSQTDLGASALLCCPWEQTRALSEALPSCTVGLTSVPTASTVRIKLVMCVKG